MLCAICIKIFHSSDLSGDHHQSFYDIGKAASNGCKICRHVSLTLASWCQPGERQRPRYEIEVGRGWRTGFLELKIGAKNRNAASIFVHVSGADKFPDGYTDFLDTVNEDLNTNPCRVRDEFPAQRPIADNTGHQSVIALAKKWLETCKREHKCEQGLGKRQPGWAPSRLIKVGGPDEPPRLVITAKERANGPYAAVSHCWGKNPDFLKLTTSNIDDLCKEIPLASLPASFREVILTSRRLAIPYLWIDSLCILQSGSASESDWQFHVSGEMSHIYSFCDLNISIDVAANPEEGAFRSRDPRFLQDCYVWTSHTHLASSSGFRSRGDSTVPQTAASHLSDLVKVPSIALYAIFTQEDFSYARIDLPLSKRAWTFQELLLSPRTLHFQTDRISWQCEERQALTEYLHDSQASNSDPRGFDCLYQFDFNLKHDTTVDLYHDRVIQYTDRNLSHPDKDKLVAFSAIARHYSKYLGDEYHAGTFRSDMPIGLLWNTRSFRQSERRAPSWSWASVDSRILNTVIVAARKNWYRPHTTTLLSTVEDVRVDLVDAANPYGQVKAGFLTMKGPVMCWTGMKGEYIDDGSSALGPYWPCTEDYLVDRNFAVKTGMGVEIQLFPDEIGPWCGNNEAPWALEADKVFIMPVANMVPNAEEIERRELHKSEEERKMFPMPKPTCVGLALKRLDDGTYTRLGIWKSSIDIVENCREPGAAFEERTIVIV